MFYVGNKEIYNEQELSEAVFNTIKWYRDYNQELVEQNSELHDHALEKVEDELKDIVKTLEKRLSLSYGEFASDKEKAAYQRFEQKHLHDRLTSRYNGGRVPYLIPTGVGIGTNLKVVCPICGEQEDITDTEMW